MPVEAMANLDDERLAPFRRLRSRAGPDELFVVEGSFLVERLLRSDFETVSVLASPHQVQRVLEISDSSIPILQLETQRIRELVGFQFHRGMLACARRKPNPAVDSLVRPEVTTQTVIACPVLRDDANLGSILRISAAFGATGCLLGPDCADPFLRKALRLSMGAAFTIPIRVSIHPLDDIRQLMRESGFESVGTVLNDSAEPLKTAVAPVRMILVVGNEHEGLDEKWITCCDRCLTIPMQLGTDSLNVAVATGIILHQLRGT